MPAPTSFLSKYCVMTFMLAPKNCDSITRIMPLLCSQKKHVLFVHRDQRDGASAASLSSLDEGQPRSGL